MAGEKDLRELLSNLSPTLLPGEFVFCSFDGAQYGDHVELEPIASVVEDEGLTLVIPLSKAAEHGLEREAVFKAITLRVHSSLEAVGLTAAIADLLARQGISANVVAGYFHDHVFVPRNRGGEALAALRDGT